MPDHYVAKDFSVGSGGKIGGTDYGWVTACGQKTS